MAKVSRIELFRKHCNHTNPPWGNSVIMTFREGGIIKVVLYIEGEPAADKEVSIRAIKAGVPEIMAKDVVVELVEAGKEKIAAMVMEEGSGEV